MNPSGIDGVCKLITLIVSLFSSSPEAATYHEPDPVSIYSHYGEVNLNSSLRLLHTTGQTQGRRSTQQDNYFPYHSDQSASLSNQSAFFGVYDGHGEHGGYVAQVAAQHLHFNLINRTNFRNDPSQALIDSFHCTQANIDNEKGDQSGTTAIVALLHNNILYLANTGDSRAVLYNRNGKIIIETIDHKPDNEQEKKRIKEDGGIVTHFFNDCPRVNGELATSRALGDFCFGKVVLATPDIIEHELDGNEQFLILASDGLWDEINNEKVFEYILEYLQKHEIDINNLAPNHLQLAAEDLIKKALTLGSHDNITVTIIYFKH